MRLINLLLLLVGAYAVAFSANAEHVSDPALVAKGAKLYSQNCGRCHNPKPASEYSKEEWSVFMPHMRERAHMTGTEALAVEAFLASTLTADVRNQPAETGAPQRSGETLVAQFGCAGCHQVKGAGGKLGPTLDGVVAAKGKEFIMKKLMNPKFNNSASAMPKYPMSKADIQEIIDYISK